MPYTASDVMISSDPNGLAAIDHPSCAAAIWTRSPLETFQAWLDSLAPHQLPQARLVLKPQRVYEALVEATRTCDVSASHEHAMLVEDASALASMFAAVTGATYIKLRLEQHVASGAGAYQAAPEQPRLICTYRGAGLQYGTSVAGAAPKRVSSVPTSAVIVLRGTRAPYAIGCNLMHRTPPLDEGADIRFALVIDPAPDPEAAIRPLTTYH